VLARRIGVSAAALAASACPAVAIAAVVGEDRKQVSTADRGEAKIAPLHRPVRRLQKTIDVQVKQIRAAQRRKRAQEREEAYATLPGGVSIETLEAIAACESGGDPTIVSADGTYRGKYQFSYETWASVGGSGDPAAAPEAEQDYRAALLYAQAGSSPWPVCGV
jgi:hypothetical protein